jgi:hypothetical protein
MRVSTFIISRRTERGIRMRMAIDDDAAAGPLAIDYATTSTESECNVVARPLAYAEFRSLYDVACFNVNVSGEDWFGIEYSIINFVHRWRQRSLQLPIPPPPNGRYFVDKLTRRDRRKDIGCLLPIWRTMHEIRANNGGFMPKSMPARFDFSRLCS